MAVTEATPHTDPIDAPTSVLDRLTAEHADIGYALGWLASYELPPSLYPPYVSSGEVAVMCQTAEEWSTMRAIVQAAGSARVDNDDEYLRVSAPFGAIRLEVWIRRERLQPVAPISFETAVSCVSHRFGPTVDSPSANVERLAAEGEWT